MGVTISPDAHRRLPNNPFYPMIRQRIKHIMTYVEDPAFMRQFNGWAAIFFAVLIIPSIIFGWLEVVAFVSVLSIWALTAAHWAAWQGARVEEKEDKVSATKPKRIRISHAVVRKRKIR